MLASLALLAGAGGAAAQDDRGVRAVPVNVHQISPHPNHAAMQSLRDREKIDEAPLATITLEPTPTHEDCRHYVVRILDASRNQQYHFAFDPQVAMLATVPPEHLDVLLAQWGQGRLRSENYIPVMLQSEHGRRYRDAIIERMGDDERLLAIIERQGWRDLAAPRLIDAFRRNPLRVSPTWLRAAVATNDPALIEPMIVRLIHAPSRAGTFVLLERLAPGDSRLGPAVDAAWQQARGEGEAESRSFAQIAARFGHLDAVDACLEVHRMRLRGRENLNEKIRERAREAHDRHLGGTIIPIFDYDAAPGDFLDWYDLHRAHFQWDPATKKFYLPTVA